MYILIYLKKSSFLSNNYCKIAKIILSGKQTCRRAARAPTLKTYFFLVSRDVSGNVSTNSRLHCGRGGVADAFNKNKN